MDTNMGGIEVAVGAKPSRWKIARRVLGVIFLVYTILVGWRAWWLLDNDQIKARVAEIHAIRFTLADVDGTTLPPVPDEAANTATVAGIDLNKNYVRDDIEHYLFEKYPDVKERAAWMQQAREYQLLLLGVSSKQELKAIMEEGSRANLCLASFYKTSENFESASFLWSKKDELSKIAANTLARKDEIKRAYSFMSSSGGIDGKQCDVFTEEN